MSLKYNIKSSKNSSIRPINSIFFNPHGKRFRDITTLLENRPELRVYSGRKTSGKKANPYDDLAAYITNLIDDDKFCKNINSRYIDNSLKESDAILVISSNETILPNGTIYGFALLKFDEKYNAIYIDLICTNVHIKGSGELLITLLEQIADEIFMEYIYLFSVDTAVNFYKKYGFIDKDEFFEKYKFDIDVDAKDDILIKHIDKKFGGHRKRKYNRKTRKIRK